jgi:uncharacterized protein HemX
MFNPFSNEPPPWAKQLMGGQVAMMKGIQQIMAAVQVDQTALDTLASNLEAVKTALSSEIASLQASLPEADLSGLNQALTDLQGLEPPAPTPAP